MNKHLASLTLLTALCTPALMAQPKGSAVTTTDVVDASAAVRIDWQQDYRDGDIQRDNSGFEAKVFMFRIDGMIAPGLTYSWRQRLNKAHNDSPFLNATDWLFLNWNTGRWNLSFGKQVVNIGGYEYDRNPLDVYVFSDFSYNIACYQLGASAGYDLTPADRLTLQLSQSPFFSKENRNLYAWNLMWSGSHGCWSALWSANMMQYQPGRWINYLALGNKFSVDKAWLELDLMNRAVGHSGFFSDHSVVAMLGWDVNPNWTLHAKGSYDRNGSGRPGDYCVADGTDLKMVGGGVEFYPIRRDNHRLRLNANCYYSWGRNANAADLMQDKSLLWGLGATWEMDLFSVKKK